MTFQYTGGYFFLNEPLVRGGSLNGHTANDMSGISKTTVDAVNLMQDTPWEINPYIMDVINAFTEIGEDVVYDGELILRLTPPDNPRLVNPDGIFDDFNEEVWKGMDKTAKKQFKAKRARHLNRYEKQVGSFRGTLRVIDTAREMSQFDKMYFPHNMCFRTRIYPIPSDLNMQASDLSKGLLRFRRATRLGPEGVYWMAFAVATHWGEDKLSPDARVAYTMDEEFSRKCAQWVDDPLTNRGWLAADKPFQFLAVAYEWVWANRLDNPEDYYSQLPGNLDGSCNGAQHLSILARDLKGATATNCRSNAAVNGVRHDLYMKVADAVWETVKAQYYDPSHEMHHLAKEWFPKMEKPSDRRKVVKRSVMTVPYGVTRQGIAEFMRKEHVSEESEQEWDSAFYMRDLVWDAINETMVGGRELQFYFARCAERCAEAGVPLSWDTPAGSKVTQAYRNLISRRVACQDTRFVIYEEPKPGEGDEEFFKRIGMNVEKMVTAAPPNVIHSFDASHLQLTVVEMAKVGIRDFSMIHDSFGCPFAHVGTMRDILRNVIVDMYSDNFLLKWKESVERYSGLTMEEPPALGEFDITEILQSEYFFS